MQQKTRKILSLLLTLAMLLSMLPTAVLASEFEALTADLPVVEETIVSDTAEDVGASAEPVPDSQESESVPAGDGEEAVTTPSSEDTSEDAETEAPEGETADTSQETESVQPPTEDASEETESTEAPAEEETGDTQVTEEEKNEENTAAEGALGDVAPVTGSDNVVLPSAELAEEEIEQSSNTIDLSAGSYTIEADGDYVVSAYTGSNTLTVKADATVTLESVNITAPDDQSAISVEGGNVTLNFTAASTLTGGDNGAGIYVAEAAALTVKGGKVVAKGNAGVDDDSGAAGIGGTWAAGNSGTITIDGATVVAEGWGVHGSGIGSGSGKVVGKISIINGASVTARGGYYADGVGTKLQSSYGSSDPEGGAAIGGGGKTASTIADITIEDSEVIAFGGSKAAGIGANFWCSCSTITISGASVVKAQGGSSSAGIGTSRAGDNGVGSTIVIEGGEVTATGGAYGAGIGAGYNADSLGNGADESALPETSITISGGTVVATGGEGGAGIGGGYKSDNIDVDITGGSVTAVAGALVSGKTVANGGAAAAIGSGANGSGVFENSPAAEISSAATLSVTAHYEGKAAIEGMTNDEVEAMENVTLVEEGKPVPVAKVGGVEYMTLQAAIDAAVEGDTVTLLGDVTLTEALTIAADKSFTLDLAGKSVSQKKECSAHYGMIVNSGDLTVTDSVGGGKISFTDTGVGDSAFGWGSYTLINYGTLTVNGGTIENLSQQNSASSVVHMYCAIQQQGGTVTVNGGTVATETYRSIRVNKGDLVVTGGECIGQVWLQPNQGDVTLNISGGQFDNRGADGSAVFMTNAGEGYTVADADISGGTFDGKIGASNASALAGCITGGKFNADAVAGTNTALLAEGVEFGAVGTDGYAAVEATVTGLSGSGTETNPYLISTAKELAFFRDKVNANDAAYNAAGVYFALGADIDMSGINWEPIGSATAAHGFMGNFDGKTFTIKNLTIENPAVDSDGYAYAAFFGVTEGVDSATQNTIKNLTLENVTVSTSGHIAAAAIAYPYYTVVDNVKVCGDISITGGNYTSGVLAYTRRCVDASNLTISGNTGSAITGAQAVGGVISDIQMNGGLTANYSNFSASGLTITGTKSVGGISGIISGQTLNTCTVEDVVLNCTDARVGTVSGSMGSVSTITNATVKNVTGASAVIGGAYSGGAAIEAKVGDKYFATLTAAVAAAEGSTVTLLSDVTLTEGLTVAEGESLTLDLGGKTLTGTPTESAAYAVITNKGTLTVTDSVGDGALVCDHQLAGSTSYAVNTITNSGTLLIEGGKIENKSTSTNQIGYAIDNNSTSASATVTVKGGKITASGSGYYDGIRLFANSETNENTVVVEGGSVSSIWLQNPSDGSGTKDSKDVKGSVTVSGGEVGALYLEPSSAFAASVTGGKIDSISYYTTSEGRDLTGFVTGGTFGSDVSAFCAVGFECVDNGDGTYGVAEDPTYGMVAQIGDDYFATLGEAIAAAEAGAEIILLADCSVSGEVTAANAFTLTFDGKKITVEDGATLSFVDGTVLSGATVEGTGTVKFYGAIGFNGTNSVTAGVGGSPFHLTVNKGATLLISRFVLGYGRAITVEGEIEDAHTFDPTGLTPNLKFNSTSGVSVGGTNTGALTVNNAYVELNSSSWKNAYGTYEWKFTNSYVSATSLGNNNAKGSDDAAWTVTFDDCVVAAKTYIKNGVGTTYNFIKNTMATTGSLRIDGVMYIDETSSVTTTAQQNNEVGAVDEHGGINGAATVAGTLTIGSNAKTQLELLGGTLTVTETGSLELGTNTLTLDADSKLTSVGDITGAITVADGAEVAISGGNYTTDVSAYVVDSCELKDNGDGTYTVKAKPVAKVGDVEYETIDAAIAAWTNGTTLTLLADVTLSDVITLKSTEHHILDLGTYTMTAASKKNAIEIENCGRSSASYALDIKADATNPGGITATGKAIVRTAGKSGVKDRPIIRFYGGVFNASYIAQHSGSNGTNCPQFQFHGGEYTGTISTNRALNQFYGGVFHGSLMMSVDSSAYTLISGGTFKQLSNLYMSALNSGKFTIGSAKGVYDREVYVNDDGYYVVAAAKPAEGIEASAAKKPGTNDYLAYSKVGTEGALNYTSVEKALADNASGTVTVYVDELDLTGTSFKGTIVVSDGLAVTYAEGTTPAWSAAAAEDGKAATYTESVENGVVTRTYMLITPVAKIGETYYETLAAAIAAAEDGDTVIVLAGEHTVEDASIAVAKDITIQGEGKESTKLVFDSAASAFVIESSGVTFENMTIAQGTKSNSFHISISKGAWDAPVNQYSDISIQNVDFVGGNYALCLIGEDVMVDSCSFTEQSSHNIIVYSLKGESKITNNVFNASTGSNKSAILYEGGADNATDTSGFIGGGTLTISGNEAYGKGVFFQFTSWGLVEDMNVAITGNVIDAFTNKAIALYDMDGAITASGDEFASVVVKENAFTNVPDGRPILKEYTGMVEVDASANYLGSEAPDLDALLVGDEVIVSSYYTAYDAETGELSGLESTTVAQVVDADGNVSGEFRTFAEALTAAQDGETVELVWAEGDDPIAMNGSVFGKSVTVTGTAQVDWSKGFLFIGRGGEGDGTLTFENATLTSVSDNASYGIHVSGREKDTTNKYDGTLNLKSSVIELDYLINKGTMTLDASTLTVKNGFSVGGRPASETESGEDATATVTLTNGSKLTVDDHNGMGLGYEAIGVMSVDATSAFETTQRFLVTAKGTLNLAGTAVIAGTLTNNGSIVLTDAAATLTASEGANVTTTVADHVVSYADGVYSLEEVKVAAIGNVTYPTLQKAIDAAAAGETVTVLEDIVLTEGLTVASDDELTLDLNGKSVTYSGSVLGEAMLVNNGTLTLTSSVEGGIFDYTYTGEADSSFSKGNYTIENRGKLTVAGGTVKNSTAKMSHAYYAITNYAAELNVTGGEVLCDTNRAIRLFGANDMTMSGGYVEGTIAIYLQAPGSTGNPDINLTVTGGEIKGTDATYNMAVYSYSNGDSLENVNIVVEGGTFQSDIGLTGGKNKTAIESVAITGGTFAGDGVYSYGDDALAAEAIEITGGAFGTNYAEQYALDDGYIFTANDDGTYGVKAGSYVAEVNGVKYETIAEAMSAAVAGDTVTIFAGEYDTGITLSKAITVVGETDAEGNNLVKLNGSVTLKADGAAVKNLTASNPAEDGYNSTLNISAKDVLVEGCEITDFNAMRYSYTSGKVTIRDSVLTATGSWAVHFDGNAGGDVVLEGCEVNGWIAFSGSLDKVTMTDSTFTKGNYSGGRTYNKDVVISGCTFENGYKFDLASAGSTVTVTDSAMADGSSVAAIFNGNDAVGNNTITIDGDPLVYIASSDGQYYETLQAAIDAAADGATVTLLADITGDASVSKSLTIDGANFKYTGNISVSGNTTVAVVKNVNFVNGTGYAVTTNRIKSITVEDCTVADYGYGFLYANKSTPTVEVKNVTVNGGNYGIHWVYGTSATLENVTMTNVANGLYIQNYASKTVTLKNCSITGINIWERDGYSGVQTFKFEGENAAATLADSQFAKYVLATADATLAAPEGSAVTTAVADSAVVYADGAYKVVKAVAAIGETMYPTLQAAIDAAADGATITLLDDCAEDVTVSQAPNVKLTIDGNDKTYSGTITVDGKSACYETAALTVKNVNFDATGISKDASINLGGNNAIRYTSNVTVEDCSFTGTGNTKVGVKQYTGGCHNLVVTDCTATGMHSLMQLKNVEQGLKVTGCTVTDSKNGISIGASSGAVIDGCTVTTTGYGVRADGSGEYTASVTNSTITAAQPVVVRNTSAAYVLSVSGNTLTSTEEGGYQVVVTAGDDGVEPTEPTGEFVISGNIDELNVYPNSLYEAKLGEKNYMSLADAFADAQDGDEVKVIKAGTYALSTSGKDITVTGTVDGVVFANIGAKSMGGADVTFNNVTFEYATNSTYKGLQHAGNLVYNDCTFNGQVFLYGESETFNKCEFNNTDAASYNVWTYGAKEVAFNECEFNCAGKSVLIYAESAAITNDVTVTDCVFTASAPVEGKAAIEMDSSLTAGIELTVSGTTASGFATGSVSGNSLWNNKKGNATMANNDITVVVDDVTVLEPWAPVAAIGEAKYATIAEAMSAAVAGDTVTIFAGEYDTGITLSKAITVVGETDAEGNNLVKLNGSISLKADGAAVKNLTASDPATTGYDSTLNISAKDVLVEGCEITDFNAMRYCYTSGKVTIRDSVLTATGSWAVHFDGNAGGDVVLEGCEVNGWIAFSGSLDKVTMTDSTFTKGNYSGGRTYNKDVEISGCTFESGYKFDLASAGAVVTVTDSAMSDGSSIAAIFNGNDAVGNNTITIDGEPLVYIASSNGQYFETLQAAVEAVADGATIKLLDDITATEVILIAKAITLNGNGHSITSSASRVIRVAADATINDLDVVSTAVRVGTNDIRGISVDNVNNVSLTLSNCSVDFTDASANDWSYAVNQSGETSTGNTITISGGSYEGANVVNIWGSGHTVTVDGATLTSLYGINDLYHGVCVKANGTGESSFTVTNSTFNGDHAVAFETLGTLSEENNTDNTKRYVAKVGTDYYYTLSEALEAAKSETNIVVDLIGNATLDITAWQTLAIGGDTTESITINGNDKTLTFNKLNSDWNNIATNNGAKLILNDMTISDSGKNGGPWNRYDHNFACDVELNNVTSTKPLAFKAGATLNDVTVTDSSNVYAIWIQPNGQSIEIDGLTVNCGRGIKIDNQYVDEAEKVTLNISDATFNTTAKAAIIVKTPAGAAITASEVDITNVAADSTNLVWIDEDAGAYYGKVSVTGGSVALENMPAFVATTGEGENLGYYKTLAEAINAAAEGAAVTLLQDVALTETMDIEKSVILDLGGKTVTGADGAVVFNIKAATTMKNGTVLGNKSGTSSGLIDIYADLDMDGVTLETGKINALRFKAGECTATLTNCSVTGAFKGYGSSVWNIQSGTYKASSTAISDQLNGTASVSGGTFHYAIDEVDCANGYVVVNNGDGTYTVKYAPACFVDADNDGVLDEGEAVYGNLEQVFGNHTEGDVYVVLTADIASAAQVDTDADAMYYFTTNVAEGVTMDFLYADDWNYVQKMSLGENITLNAPYFLGWTELVIAGTVNTTYAYFLGADVTVTETGVINANTGDATVQVKDGTKLTVNGTVNTAILNVWVNDAALTVSGANAKLTASWIDIWDGTPTVTVTDGATLKVDAIKASRGGSITVDATLDTDKVELGHNGESAGTMTVTANGAVTGETELTAVGSTLTGPEGMNVTTNVAEHKVAYANGVYSVVEANYIALDETGAMYESIQDAIDAVFAQGGGIVTLRKGAVENTVVVKKGVTLDLNGQTLESDYLVAFNGGHVTDSVGGGKVLCERKGMMLSADNESLPVWVDDGYVFETVSQLIEESAVENGSFKHRFLPRFETIEELLKNGGDPYGLDIQVVLGWDEAGMRSSKVMTYTDDMLKDVYGNEKVFVITLNDYADYLSKNLTLQVMITSELGVTYTGNVVDIAQVVAAG